MEPDKAVKGVKFMNQSLYNALSFYCANEIENFKSNEIFINLQNLVKELNYTLVCEYGKEYEAEESGNIYLSITVLDDKNEMIEIYDEGFLSASTLLVSVDKKHRYKFISWDDTEFIEDLNWLISQLTKTKNKQNKK